MSALTTFDPGFQYCMSRTHRGSECLQSRLICSIVLLTNESTRLTAVGGRHQLWLVNKTSSGGCLKSGTPRKHILPSGEIKKAAVGLAYLTPSSMYLMVSK